MGFGFEIIFFMVFLTVFGIIIFTLIKGIMQWNRNNNSPRLTVPVLVVSKRTQISNHHHNTGTNDVYYTSSTTYYVTFQVESGDRMEFHVNGSEYGLLAEGDIGKLTFQGTRYISFVRENF